jgi:methyl-accepting chemotaxis protein
MNKSNDEISSIVKVIAEIGDKTKVINDIVFQTKLLSFNASVEAARAGEQGKGFAVVAEEVGNLATMSGKAAEEISSMLGDSMGKVELIVMACPMALCGLSGATTTTSPIVCITEIKVLIPGAVIPSSLVTKIRGRLDIF